MLLSVKSMARINVNVAMIEAGMATDGDDDRAQVPDEEEHDQRREQAAPDQVLLERRDRGVDEPGVVGGDRERDVGRQRLTNGRRACSLTPSMTLIVFSPEARRMSSCTPGRPSAMNSEVATFLTESSA